MKRNWPNPAPDQVIASLLPCYFLNKINDIRKLMHYIVEVFGIFSGLQDGQNIFFKCQIGNFNPYFEVTNRLRNKYE